MKHDADAHAVLSGEVEGLYAVALEIGVYALLVDATANEIVAHSEGTFTRETLVDGRCTCLAVGIAGEQHTHVRMLTEVADEFLQLIMLGNADDAAVDFELDIDGQVGNVARNLIGLLERGFGNHDRFRFYDRLRCHNRLRLGGVFLLPTIAQAEAQANHGI